MESIFTKIVKGEIPAYKVAETKDYLAFLDVFPLVKGHVLVIPKKQVDNIFDLEKEVYAGLFLFAQEIAIGMKKVLPCKKIGIAVIGLEVPHAHIHLVPINGVEDINFALPKLQVSKEELEEISNKITLAIKG